MVDIAFVLIWLIMDFAFKRVFADPDGDAYKDTYSNLGWNHTICRLLVMMHCNVDTKHYWLPLATPWGNKWLILNDPGSVDYGGDDTIKSILS